MAFRLDPLCAVAVIYAGTAAVCFATGLAFALHSLRDAAPAACAAPVERLILV